MSPSANGNGLTLVVGYDGSAASRAAVDYAARRAGAGGKVLIVHAYGPPPDYLGRPEYQRILQDHQSRGYAVLDALVLDDDPLLDTNFETELLEEPAPDAIMAAAEAHDADEIVVGTRGHGRLRSALGSVSQDVVHRSRIPVVVIPPAAGENGG